jgi:hypothetical protein
MLQYIPRFILLCVKKMNGEINKKNVEDEASNSS